jgi:hypothetical protein
VGGKVDPSHRTARSHEKHNRVWDERIRSGVSGCRIAPAWMAGNIAGTTTAPSEGVHTSRSEVAESNVQRQLEVVPADIGNEIDDDAAAAEEHAVENNAAVETAGTVDHDMEQEAVGNKSVNEFVGYIVLHYIVVPVVVSTACRL